MLAVATKFSASPGWNPLAMVTVALAMVPDGSVTVSPGSRKTAEPPSV